MTVRKPSRNRRVTGPAIVVGLGLTGLVLGSALAIMLRGGPGLAPLPTLSGTAVEPSIAGPAPTPVSAASTPPALSSAGASSSAVPSSTAVPPPPSGTLARIDPQVLTILPATVGGLALHEFPEAEQQAAADPDLGQNVVRFATAFVGDANGANWAYVAVVDVRPGAGTEAFYRDWRDSFDVSACERAGGVAGHSTIVIAARTVERTNCGSGVRTYHVRVDGSNLLVSVSDLGDLNLGQVILGTLTPQP